MMKYLPIIFFSFVSSILFSQSKDRNYVLSTAASAPVQSEEALDALDDSLKTVSLQYFDGLGRPMQSIAVKNSPSGKDLITPVVYDEFGRVPVDYLPYAVDNSKLAFRPEAIVEQGIFYQSAPNVAHSAFPFSEKEFEASPLNRVLRQGAPGQPWQLDTDHTIKTLFRTNGAEEVRLWKFENDTWTAEGFFEADQLFVNSLKDEHNNEVLEFKDNRGRVLLKKVQAGDNLWASTCFLYDRLGNLRIVIQPEGVAALEENDWQLNEKVIDKFCFTYRYDGLRRVIEKRVPSSEAVFIVYDKLDRVVLTQDANQRSKDQWSYSKYDALGRNILTGTWTDPQKQSREQVQLIADAQNSIHEVRSGTSFEKLRGYSNQTFPTENTEILTVNYFDDYDFNYNGSGDVLFYGDSDFPDLKKNPYVRGLPTASEVRVLGSDAFLRSVMFYDEYKRVIHTQSVNHDGGTELTWNELDFVGKVLKTKHRHCINVSKKLLYNQNEGFNNQSFKSDQPGYFSAKRKRRKKVNRKQSLSLPQQQITNNQERLLGNNNNQNLLPQLDVVSKCITLTERFTYDNAQRPKKAYLQIDNGPEELLSELVYNELGQLIRKDLGVTDTSVLQAVDYAYNIRGWLTKMNDADLTDENDLFGFELNYDKGNPKLQGTDQFNGNIALQTWQSRLDSVKRGFGYSYDPLNRLKQAFYAADDKQNPDLWTNEINRFSTESMTYDLNGNILGVNRGGMIDSVKNVPVFGTVDQMSYGYSGNRLAFVNDQAPEKIMNNDFRDKGSKGSLNIPEYSYDDAGNMIEDKNKSITVSYNHLNLPETIDFGKEKKIVYVYDAAGTKLQKHVFNGDEHTVKDYHGRFEYTGEKLDHISHAEGFFTPDEQAHGGYANNYKYADHLGNTRQIFRASVVADTSWLATMEPNKSQEEEIFFANLPETRNNEEAKEGKHSAKLVNQQGPLLIIDTVRQGERYTASVWHYYSLFNILPMQEDEEQQSNPDRFGFPLFGIDVGTPRRPERYSDETPDPAKENTESVTPNPTDRLSFMPRVNAARLISLFLKNKKTEQKQLPPPPPLNPAAFLIFELTDTSGTTVKQEKINVGDGFEWRKMNHALDVDFKSDTMKQGTLKIWVENTDTNPVWFDSLYVQGLKQDSAMIVQETHYRPFGLSINPLQYQREGTTTHDYQYNNKEIQSDFDLNWNDYGARFYDPQIARWHALDVFADVYYEHSPYSFVANNPIKYIDPDGNIITDANGNIVVTTTGQQVSTGYQQMGAPTVNADGTQTATYISRTYDVVTLFADNGTPVEALKIASATSVNAIFDKDGNYISETSPTAVDNSQYDVAADCHGYTFTDDKLWINNDQVETILNNDDYSRNVSEGDASAVVFKDQDGNVVHSSGRNTDGTYTSNAGVTKTQYNVTLGQAGGDFYTGQAGNAEFVKKDSPNKTMNTTLGTVNDKGLRVISDHNEVKQFMNSLNGD